MTNVSFTKDKIVDYWIKFFPEIDKDELERIVEFGEKVTFEEIAEAYSDYDNTDGYDVNDYADFDICEPIQEAISSMEAKELFYVSAVLPLVNRSFKSLIEKCAENDMIEGNEFFSIALSSLFEKAINIIIKPFIYEFSYLSQHGALDSDTEQNKKMYFCNVYSRERSNMEKFYREYAAITKLVSLQLDEECDYLAEILENVRKRSEDIKNVFGIDIKNDKINKIKTSSGDTHQKGRTVAEVVFASGAHFMYKPHQMKIDQGFRELLDWMKSENSDMHDHRTPEIISDESFGFAGFVEHNECANEEEVQRFYERSGELLAVLYSINGSDMHFENIISDRDYPVLIDLETLLHPTLSSDNDKEKYESAKTTAAKLYQSSVLNIGMLPMYMGGNLDVGGFSAAETQTSQQKSDSIVDEDSDNIHIERTYGVLEPQKNNPVLDGKNVQAHKYLSFICSGFRNVYNWIEAHKSEYISKIEEIFVGITGRIVIRATNTYAQLLNIAQDQAFSRKDYERSLILHRIFIDAYKQNKTVALTEYDALMNGDVPYFTFIIGDNRLYNEDGMISDEEMLVPLLDNIKKKINNFSAKDLAAQIGYIEGSFVKRRDEMEFTGTDLISRLKGVKTTKNTADKEKWLKTSESIAELLIENAIEGKDKEGRKNAAWNCVTVDSFEEDNWVPSVMGDDIYGGNCGVVLYLSQLGKITENKRYIEYAEMAMRTSVETFDQMLEIKNAPIGAYSGLSGAAYIAAHLGRVTGNTEWKERAVKYLTKCGEVAADDKAYDYIAGSAGAIAVAVGMKDIFADDPQALSNIVQSLADSLASSAESEDNGIVWKIEGKDKKKEGFTGFAHGNAGIHSSLYLAGKFLGTDKYNDIVKGSLERERIFFDKASEGWKRSDTDNGVQHVWCHGSAGMLLSKLLMVREGFTDEHIGTEIRKAVNSVIKYGFGYGPSYCHGDLGNFAVLDFAARQLEDKELKKAVDETFSDLFNDQLADNWNTTRFKSCMNYGMMLGLSGWGYAMLSHYTDFAVPQFLWLE